MLKVVLSLVAVTLLPWVPAPVAAEEPIAVWAHRGGRAEAPENTLGAFRKAAAMFASRGLAKNMELDVHLSADGVPMVIHDATLDATTNCSGPVNAKTAAELALCDASVSYPGWPSFEPVPTLASVVEAATTDVNAPWNLMIEIKGIPTDSDFDPLAPAAEAVMDELEGFPASQTIIQSFWPPALDRIELRRWDIPTLLLTTSTLPGAPQGAGFLLSENILYTTLRGYEISAPASDTLDLLAETVTVAHLAGKPVIVWTVNSTGERDRMASYGVDGIITDEPTLMTA